VNDALAHVFPNTRTCSCVIVVVVVVVVVVVDTRDDQNVGDRNGLVRSNVGVRERPQQRQVHAVPHCVEVDRSAEIHPPG